MAVLQEDQRRRLNREAVIDGALALADAEGLDALTIRRLADRLDVTPMALYWHFKNKDVLLAGLVERVWSMVDIETDPAAPWIDRLMSIMESLVRVLRAHPGLAPLLVAHDSTKAMSCLTAMEAAMAILDEGGFPPEEASAVCIQALRTAVALTLGDPARGEPNEDVTEDLRQKRILLRSLPPERFPHVIASADALTDCDNVDSYYRFGLDLFYAGVAAMAARR